MCRGTRVHFPRGLPRSIIQKSAPREYIQYARNPARNVEIGGKHTVFAPVYGPPFIRNLDEGRRYAHHRGFPQFREARLHVAGDAPFRRHGLRAGRSAGEQAASRHGLRHISYSDKPFMGSVTHPSAPQDTVEMAKILFGEDFLEKNTVITSLINANSPMVWDGTMLGALKVYARNNQACIVSPFILAGAMSPVTVAGTLAQVLAEVLAGAATAQLVRPGAPVIFGVFASSISMQSGAPTFGTPEPTLVCIAAGAAGAATWHSLPHRRLALRLEDADAQAAYESAQTLLPPARRHEFRAACGGLARRRARLGLREVRHGCRPARHDADARRGRRPDRKRPGDGCDPRSRPGRAATFSGLRAHAGEFRDRVLPLDDRRQQQLRAMGGRGRAGRATARQSLWKRLLREYEAPALDPASTRR